MPHLTENSSPLPTQIIFSVKLNRSVSLSNSPQVKTHMKKKERKKKVLNKIYVLFIENLAHTQPICFAALEYKRRSGKRVVEFNAVD